MSEGVDKVPWARMWAGREDMPACCGRSRRRVTDCDVWADERLRRVARRAPAQAGSGAEAALTP